MKKKILIFFTLIFLLIIFFLFLRSRYTEYTFDGKYYFRDESTILTIELVQNGRNLIGSHCLTIQNGNKIDCDVDREFSINGNITRSGTAFIEIKSHYSGRTVKGIILKQTSADTLDFIKSDRQKDTFFPSRVKLEREI